MTTPIQTVSEVLKRLRKLSDDYRDTLAEDAAAAALDTLLDHWSRTF